MDESEPTDTLVAGIDRIVDVFALRSQWRGSCAASCGHSASASILPLVAGVAGKVPNAATVALADPFPDEYELYRSALSEASFEVLRLETTDPVTAAAMVIERRPHAVITRIRPGVFGIELMRHLREDAATKGTPVIVITTHTDQGVHAAALRAGANAVHLLPLDPQELINSLRRELRRAHRPGP